MFGNGTEKKRNIKGLIFESITLCNIVFIPSIFILVCLIFITEAIVSDLIFFVVIRNAKDKLMHITTLYAWCFVACLPFIIYFLFRKLITKNKKQLSFFDFWKPLFIGLISFAIITIIILFNVKFE